MNTRSPFASTRNAVAATAASPGTAEQPRRGDAGVAATGCLAALALLVSLSAVQADEPHPYDVARDKTTATVADWKKQYAGNNDVLIADGLLADRSKKTVTLLAYATGIGQGESLEFFVTPASSGKDYESLSLTFAKPSDVIAALKFIGLTPGKPIDFQENRQWPRGPRVIMTLDINGKPTRAEDCVVNTDTHKPLPQTGFCFTGSYTYKDENGQSHLAADMNEAKPIAPDYNDPAAVLDLPRKAPQGVVYGFQKPSDAVAGLKQGMPITVTLAPATGDAAVKDDYIQIDIKNGPTYTVRDPRLANPEPMGTATDLPHLLEFLSSLADGKSDRFTTVQVDPAIKVDDLRKLYAVLQAVEKDRGIKLDPPLPGDLYYRAFFPDPAWRDRENRLGEPWELFLARKDGGVTARLERTVAPENASLGAKKVLQSFPVDSPDAFVKQINANSTQWSKAVFVYPPADFTYGELMAWVRPALATYPQVFVFPAQAEATTQPGK